MITITTTITTTIITITMPITTTITMPITTTITVVVIVFDYLRHLRVESDYARLLAWSGKLMVVGKDCL